MRRPEYRDGRKSRISHAFFVSIYVCLLMSGAGESRAVFGVRKKHFINTIKTIMIMKQLRTLLVLFAVSICAVQNAWADEEVSVTVSLPEPNSLSTEILKKVEDVKTVQNLTVTSGTLGDLDWGTLQSMSALKTLDLEHASADAIPASQFRGYCPNLETVKLPSDLKTIGNYAFWNKDNLITVVVPSTLESIGNEAFMGCSKLANCSLAGCSLLKTIPGYCFSGCGKLESFTIPASVTTIGEYNQEIKGKTNVEIIPVSA